MTDVLESLRVQILEAQPGDIVCLVSDRELTAEQAHQIKGQFQGMVPDGVKVAVLNGLYVDKVVRLSEYPADYPGDLLVPGAQGYVGDKGATA